MFCYSGALIDRNYWFCVTFLLTNINSYKAKDKFLIPIPSVLLPSLDLINVTVNAGWVYVNLWDHLRWERIAFNTWTNIGRTLFFPNFSLKYLCEELIMCQKKMYCYCLCFQSPFMVHWSYCQVISFLQDHLPFGLLTWFYIRP